MLKVENFSKRASQRWLFVVLCEIFDDSKVEIKENYLHPATKYPSSKQPIELDIFIPEFNLAFEFQGKQHYDDTMVFGLSQQYKSTDSSPLILVKIVCMILFAF
jgi:hypothetical protein